MAKGASYVVQYRRKREAKTNYKGRLDMLKSRTPRLVVRRSNKRMLAQLIDYAEEGDKVLMTTDSNELIAYGWKYSGTNLPAAYLTGYLAGKKALEKGMTGAVLDIGMQASVKGSRLYGVLKGAIDSGLKLPAGEKAFPDEKRLSGQHISDYASKLSKADHDKKFSGYIKAGADPKDMSKAFQEVKEKIAKGPLKAKEPAKTQPKASKK